MPDSKIVATLVSDPKTAELSDALLAQTAQALGAEGAPQRLGPDAADLFFRSSDLIGLRAALGRALSGLAVDAIVQPLAHREKKLVLADMDSTLILQECIDELAAEVGLGEKVAGITERAMRGEIEFEPALRERVALLKGLPETALTRVLETRIVLTPGARTLVRTFRARGGYFAVVSGGFTQFTGAIAAALGADEHRANRLVVENGMLTGEVATPVLGRAAKRDALDELTRKLGLARQATMAVGDGANDLAMLEAAGLGVAYRAKPAVAAAAAACIDCGDLTALLYAQGIPRDAFL